MYVALVLAGVAAFQDAAYPHPLCSGASLDNAPETRSATEQDELGAVAALVAPDRLLRDQGFGSRCAHHRRAASTTSVASTSIGASAPMAWSMACLA